jgi:glycosyltransferase involved in cell wall biosynthesis
MPLKILCVHQGYELYGSDRSFIRSLKAIRQYLPSASVTVYLPKYGPLVEHVSPLADHIAIRELGVLRVRDVRKFAVRTIIRIFADIPATVALINEFDLVYVNSLVLLSFVLSARLGRARAIVHVREIPGRIASALFSCCLSFSGATVVFNSEATRNAFRLNRRSSYVVHNGTDGFASVAPPDVGAPAFHVLLIGRINAWKGQPVLLEALTRLGDSDKKMIKVRIVGDVFEDQVRYKEHLVSMCRRYGLQQQVEILPFDANPGHHYQWSDVVVIPSTSPEPFGMVAVEAMSAARPVIASAHGGIVEVVEDGKTGVLVEPRDPGALAAAMSMLARDRVRAVAMGQAGYRRFSERFQERAYLEGLGLILRDRVTAQPSSW